MTLPYDGKHITDGPGGVLMAQSRLNRAVEALQAPLSELEGSLAELGEYARRLGDDKNPHTVKDQPGDPDPDAISTIEARIRAVGSRLDALLDRARRLEHHLADLVG